MARVLFGTDGIRAVAGEYPLDHKTANAVGASLGRWISQVHAEPRVVIGMDTRESGPWLAAEVAGGLAVYKIPVDFAGVTTTPGVAYLARTGPYAAGVMISASHNPYQDNGIKLIGHSGYKLADEQEERLERDILKPAEHAGEAASIAVDPGLDRSYIQHLASTIPRGLGGLKIVADCANGSASFLAPELFENLGARVRTIHCSPNGRNINLNCGSLHLEPLSAAMREHSADVGVAFDGDADRALFIAASGKIVNGDAVLLLLARHMQQHGELAEEDGQPVVVATVMSNLGLERALTSHGIQMVRTPVGDKYVLEEMIRRGAILGGEQSGHIIFHRQATTGDGMLTALRVFEAMLDSGESLDALTSELQVYPQLLVNVRVRERKPLDQLPLVAAEIRAAESSFGDQGRVLVRFSGTEPLARVMVEGPDLQRVEEFAHRIAAQIQADLGTAT
jgi:phosphoglucosamine mutase